MPAILIEAGFIDSTIDIDALRNDQKLKAQGEAIADGLAAHFKLKTKVQSKPKPTPPKTKGNIYRVIVDGKGEQINRN